MGGNQDLLEEFVDNILDEKFSGFRDHEYTIVKDYNLGFRLDHQGKNNAAGTKPHRLFIQPVGRGKSKASKKGHDLVLANVHCDDPEDAEAVRDALKESAKGRAKLVVV